MESRFRNIFLKPCTMLLASGLIVALSAPCMAATPLEQKSEQIIEPELERREIKQAKIDTEDFEIGIYAGAMSVEDFGVNAVFGARAAYHITENIFTEFAVGYTKTSETSYEVLGGNLQLLTGDQRDYTYYNISVGYNLFSGESFFGKRAYNSDLYVITGIGNTIFNEDDHFTWNIGVGYRFVPNDWMAIHLDVRDHMFNSDLLGADKLTHNIEIHAGVTFFF